MPWPRLTLKHAQELLRPRGVTLAKREGEYRVNLRGAAEDTAYYTDNLRDAITTGIDMIHRSRGYGSKKMPTTRAASRRWTRHEHGDKCRKHAGGVEHDKGCRVSRPRCKYRRQVCRCSAAPWPHRPGSMRGCREGGIPEILMQSRSFREAHGYGEKKRGTRGGRSETKRGGAKRRHFSRTRSTRFKRG